MFLVFVALFAGLGVMFYTYKHLSKKAPNLKGKHVLITGGSKGIGKSLAVQVIDQGANVTILARNKEALDETKMDLLKRCTASGKQKVLVYSVDVGGDYNDVERVVGEAESVLGPIFLLVCCAGNAISLTFDETNIENFHRMMNVNYFGSVNLVKAVLPSMKARNEGHIVLFSSVAGLFGVYGFAAYCAAKFAIVGLAQSLSMEV